MCYTRKGLHNRYNPHTWIGSPGHPEVAMENSSASPPTPPPGAALRDDDGPSTDVLTGGSSADRGGPPSAPRLEAGPAPAQRTLSQLGDFLLLKKIGAGAMGSVYKARRLSNKHEVALKVLYKHVADNPRLLERFYREARVSGELDHPNIVRGFQVGQDHGWHFFAMEFVDGESLQKWLDKLGRISLGDALHIVLACARALAHAHKNDLVHRDIKPDNILITRRGEVKVADLGMVKQLDEDMSLTQTGHAVGTPWYMPLEQAKNAKETDGRCDIYALGCLLYACLTGQPPFAGKTLVDVIQAKEIGTFPPARQFSKEIPERVDLIIGKMTAKLPKYRYQNCGEVIKDLEGLGLANPALSFLHATPAAAESTDDAHSEMASTVSPSMRTPFPVQPKSDAHELWYVRYHRPDGTPVLQKLTAVQVLQLVQTPDFDPGCQATRDPKEGWRALATYKEFEKAISKVARSHADKQTFRQRKLFEKIVEQQNQREQRGPKPATTLNYWFGIFWRSAAVVAAVGMLVAAVLALMNVLK
jgi:serine/threonine-protein kinase